ncbi:hypothetical protein J2X19_000443 [Rhodoferax ferrireducens]|uniref:PH domain-containing protein n=1 Tax=Rhodoferax ferrireducens TaxID=192843 RepID=A0ABU2C375_9BURK|nr:hypothetical protein [Rhodoferax ferrireducens]MDR7375785.1 hypothetical protein [Rhodoferax ferrireducens]
MGPAPFRFVPGPGRPVEAAAFSPLFKLLATAIVGGCAVWLTQLLTSGVLGTARTTGVVWFVAGLAMMGWTWWHILRSRTRISSEGLFQGWIWDKQMPFDDLAYGKLIRIPGLDWLIAPRLYVRTLMGKFMVFYGASPELVAEFERIVKELKAFRQL